MNYTLLPGHLAFADFRILRDENTKITLDPACAADITASEKTIFNIIAQEKTTYGVNTGFGALAHTRIPTQDLQLLQKHLVLSHATGTGALLDDATVRLILALKINSLARGYSGVHRHTIDALIELYNKKIYPCIPCKGSVGASGDLAPLAHLSAVLIGEGEARYQGNIISAKEALAKAGLKPLQLAAKEGLALLNGTQVSTALAIQGLLSAEDNFIAGLVAGALTVDATRGSVTPFDARIQQVRGHESQIQVAHWMRLLLDDSEILFSHLNCGKVQDPYSIRCIPQVMGACLAQLQYTGNTLHVEANAVSDNPLVFAADDVVLSGGNFHAEPVAFAADAIAIAIAEIGAISERRMALLVDPHFSQLPAFLVNNPGINSGFMIAQVTAAALASENKTYAHPGSVDSLPTSANQEDHVSMATFAARRLIDMNENTSVIVGIELLAGAQGIDFLRPLKSSPKLERVYEMIRSHVSFYEHDRYFAPDIEKAKKLVTSGQIGRELNISIF